jgi:gliding motility-associated-like protein
MNKLAVFRMENSKLMKHIRPFLYILPIIIIILATPEFINATHIVGGNMTYRKVGTDIYQIRLTLRRDCLLGSPEAQFDDPASIGIFSSSGALLTALANNGEIRLRFNSSDTLNQYIRSDCGFEGTQVCVHETTYQGLVRLPFRAGGYILAYQRCCRNETTANIVNPLETGATYWVQITEDAINLGNSTPVFKEWPDVYICASRPHVFDHSAADPDGDSLVYKLCVPNTGATLQFPRPQPPGNPPFGFVQWRSPYGLENLLGGDPLTIDPHTGVMTLNPNLVGQFLVGVCVEEYRNGQLLSTIRRDFQYNVRVCSQPPLAKFTTSESNCDGLTVEFFNESLSSSNHKWYFDFPNENPAFISTLRNPVFTYPQSGVYTVKLRATRGSDGCFDTILQQVAVFTNKVLPDFSYRLSGCDSSSDLITIKLTDQTAFDEPGYQLSEWKWRVVQGTDTSFYSGQNPEIQLSDKQNAEIKLEVIAENGCRAVNTKMIDISELIPQSDFSISFEGCTSGDSASIRLIDNSVALNPLGTIIAQNWIIGENNYSGADILVNVPISSGIIEVRHQLLFEGNCSIESVKEFNLSAVIPRADYSFTPSDCPDEGSVSIEIKYESGLANNIAVTSYNWIAGPASGQNTYTTPSFSITLPKDSAIVLSLTTVFANGCEDTIEDRFTPGPFATLSFTGSPVILCPDQSKTLVVNGNPAWTYTWSPEVGLDLTEPHNPKVNIAENITYQVTVSDGVCEVTGSVSVIALTGGITLDITGTPDICDREVNLTVTGGVGEGEYSWSTDPSFNTVLGSGEQFSIELEGNTQTFYAQFVGESCSTEPAKFIVTRQVPSVLATSPFIICPGDTVTLPVFNLIAGHTLAFSWADDPRIIGVQNSNEIRIGVGPDETEDFFLLYTVTNQYGCILTDTLKLLLRENPVVDFDFDFQECGNTAVCFKINGQFNGFVRWNFGDPDSNNDNSFDRDPCYSYTNPGTFNVLLENLVGVCPFEQVEKTFTINPHVSLDPIAPITLCKDDQISITADANLTDVVYIWKDISGNVISQTASVSLNVSSDTQLIVKATDIYGCSDSVTVDIRLFRFDYSISLKDSFCIDENGTISLVIQNPENYDIRWTPEDKIVSGANTVTPVFIGQTGLEFTVIIREKMLGCSDTSSVSPDIYQPFTFSIQGPEVFCYDESGNVRVLINNPENYNFNWSPASAFISGAQTANPTVRLRNTVLLTVNIENKLTGCKTSDTYQPVVGEPVDVSVNAEPDLTVYEGEDIEIKVTDPIAGAVYVWSTGATGTSIIVAPVETTTYTVTVTDSDGCTAVDQVTVEVRRARCDETDVYLPNAFSPNGDGNNDVLYVRSNFIDELELIIYNRWGQEVFRTTDINIGWDGTFRGTLLPPDSYAYYLRALCVNTVEYRKKGNVSLLR